MQTLRTRMKNGRPLISTPRLSLAELHLRIMTLGTFLVGGLLRTGDFLENWKSGESIALAL